MKELDELTIVTTIGELKVVYDENMKLANEYAELKTVSNKHYNKALVCEYLIECLKNKL